MINAVLIGVGGMGRGHLKNLLRMTEENERVRLVGICDVRPENLTGAGGSFNLDIGRGESDVSGIPAFTDVDELLKNVDFDLAILPLPTYLHCEMTCKLLSLGKHVFCEKPMAPTRAECEKMIKTAKENGKLLMIGQVLRFWGEYEALKELVDSKRFGEVTDAFFFRGGGERPEWSFENWLLDEERGGGALLDQHVHDVDMVNWLFGKPTAVCSVVGRDRRINCINSVSTNYLYPDKSVNAQDNWQIRGDRFAMTYRVTFEHGAAIFDKDGLRVFDSEGKPVEVSYDHESGYYREILYMAKKIERGEEIDFNTPKDSMGTIDIVEAEMASGKAYGAVVKVG